MARAIPTEERMNKSWPAMAAALLLLGCAAAPRDVKSPVGEDKVVYHINDTEAQAANALRNIGNHLEVNPKAKIVVVTHARGVDFLMNDAKDRNGNPYAVQVEQLKAQGVRFDICEITLRNRKLKKEQFIPEATYVPSGVAEITRLQQREGYAYLRP
jgi:intracellular sulfur oxidation DsrE/DsrF family protein